MKCKKCKSEIQEGNFFCTNCGTSISKNENNTEVVKDIESNTKKTLKSKLKIILPIIMTVLIIVGITIFVLITNVDDDIAVSSEQKAETVKIEIGINYNTDSEGSLGSMFGFVRFNTNTDYIMEIGDYGSESFTKTGNYTINQNIIKLTVNYDSAEYEETTTPYTEEIKILENGTLEYTDKYGATCSFSKDDTTINNKETSNILDEIYTKYPELENADIPICTDEKRNLLAIR